MASKFLNNFFQKDQKDFNMGFLSLSESEKNHLVNVEKILCNKKEFESFSHRLHEKNKKTKFYKYKIYRQTMTLENIDEFLRKNVHDYRRDVAPFNLDIDQMNEILGNLVYVNGEGFIRSEIRTSINNFFIRQVEIKIKDSEHFPFEFGYSNTSMFLRHYNVGQANMSCLYVNRTPRMIFDLGKSRMCRSAIGLLQNELSQTKEMKTILISHYHYDHYNMVRNLPWDVKNVQFIVPEPLNNAIACTPLFQELLLRVINNGLGICFIRNNRLANPIKFGPVLIGQGNQVMRDPNQHSDENSHGLVCFLEHNNNLVYIPGDVLYGDIFTHFSFPMNPTHVIIPHHSCYYDCHIRISRYINDNNIRESFIFCGPHRGHHHPHESHYSYYKNITILINNRRQQFSFRNPRNTQFTDGKINYLYWDYFDWNL